MTPRKWIVKGFARVLSNAESVQSPPFSIDGCQWKVCLRPSNEYKNCYGIFLYLDKTIDPDIVDVLARYQLTIEHSGKHIEKFGWSSFFLFILCHA